MKRIMPLAIFAISLTGCGTMQAYNNSLDAQQQAYHRSQALLDEKNIIEVNKLKSLQREQEIQAARAEGQKAQAQAAGEAQAMIEKAKGEAEANRLISGSINDRLIQYHLIDAINDKSVIYLPSGVLPIMNIKGESK